MSQQGAQANANMRIAYSALFCGGIIVAMSFGIRSGFGLYLGPISLEFGYGREVFALSIAIQNLVWGFVQPFAGAFADRFGPFRAIAIGTLFYAAGTMLLGISGSPASLHLGAGLMLGIGLSGTAVGIILGAIGQIFPEERRSWALGIVGSCASLGQFLIVPLGQTLLDTVGWSQAAVITGLFSLVMIPLGLVFLWARPSSDVSAARNQSLGQVLSEAFAHPSFWLLFGGFFVCGFHVGYIATHLPSFVVDIGLSPQTGAWALSLVGLFNVIGAYSAGVLGGRMPKKHLLSGLYLGRSLIMVGFLLLPPTEFVVYLFAAAMGLVWLGTVPLTSGLVASIYGPRYMSMLFGIVFFGHQLGGFLGAWSGGYLFDRIGSYDIVWWISIGLGVMSALLHWPIQERPVRRLAVAA